MADATELAEALTLSVKAEVAGLVHQAMTESERSLYASSKKIGVSDIGGCHEYVRRLIIDDDFTDEQDSHMPAWVGTAVGVQFEQDWLRYRNPHAMVQSEVVVPIDIEGYRLNLVGHPDIIEPLHHGNRVIDGKTKNGLSVVRKEGAERKHKFQVTMYAAAAIILGLIDDNATLALVYWDRSGADGDEPYVEEWQYDPALLEEAQDWLRDVIYALVNGEEASKDKPRQWCYSYCPFATACRGGDTDVEGAIVDEEILVAIRTYLDAKARASVAEREKKAAASVLKGLSGITPDGATLRSTWVNETDVPASHRRGYWKLDLQPAKDPKP